MSPTTRPHIRVRRCAVRVRRHDGWSWGDPEEYVPRILAAIEAALSDVVGDVAMEDGDERHVVEPVTLHLDRDGRVTIESRRALVAQIHAAPSANLAPSPTTREEGVHVDASELATPAHTPIADAGWDSLAAALGRWSRSGRLLAILRQLPTTVVRAWATAIVQASLDASPGAPTVSAEAVDAIATAVLPSSPEAAEADEPVRIVLVAAAIVAAAGDQFPDAPTMDLVLHRVARDGRRAFGQNTIAPRTQTQPRLAPEPTRRAAPTNTAVTVAGPTIVPALPFLALIQLTRLGFTDLAAAALASAGVMAPAHVFAAAVAGKTLEPPGRGWERTERERAAVRLASQLAQDEVDAGLVELAAASDLVAPAWRAALVDLYVEGRASDADACVTASGEERICGEETGLLPIAWVEGDTELQDVLTQLGDPVVRHTDVLTPLVELLSPRRGIPGLDAPALERHLGAIVGTAIGSLGQELWGEDADVPLAFERLRDLEVRVEVGDRVTIGVPRGQRWLDLRRVGLLQAWPIRWAPSGAWELVTW